MSRCQLDEDCEVGNREHVASCELRRAACACERRLMNSKIEISARGACVLSVLLLLASACSGSRSALSTEPLGASTSTATSEKSNLPACGSMTKPCDPNNLGGQTCASLGAGSGTLLCDPMTCSFDRSMCTGTGTQGGGGLGALLGAFGRGQGGRPAMGMNMNAATGMSRAGRGGGMASGGRGGSQGRQMSEQPRNEGGSGGEKSEAGEKAEGGTGGSESGSETAGAGGQAGESATQAGAGAGGEMSAAGAGGESGAPAAMSEMPMMPAPEMPMPAM